jgi:phage replication O-like protein O
MNSPFRGFRGPNYTPVPDELFDELLAELTGAELKVLLYVMRRTFGFKKGSDRISKSQLEAGITKQNGEVLDRGTGLSRRAVRIAIQNLVAKGILLKRSQFSDRRGFEATEYALNIIGQNPWVQSTPEGGSPGVESTQGPSSPTETPSYLPQSTQGRGHKVPIQETVPKIFSNVNVISSPLGEDGSDRNRGEQAESNLRAQTLVLEMLDTLGDSHSTGFYRLVATTLPEPLIFRALSETKDQAARGRIRTSRGAFFTDTITRLAREHGHAIHSDQQSEAA